MKVKCWKILMMIIGVMILLPMSNSKATTESVITTQKDLKNLAKYEIVFLYPEGQEVEVKELEEEITEIYQLAPENLIITKKNYDSNDCTRSALSDLELQGDIQYRSLVFVWTNSEMCEPIQLAMQNTSASCKHKEGFTRQKVITIPMEEETALSLETWKQGREDWYNYKYAKDTSSAIQEVYTTLDITKEQVEQAKENATNTSTNDTGKIESENTNEKKNQIVEKVTSNEDLTITHQVEAIKIVLADGSILNTNTINVDETLKLIYLDEELTHGATIYIQYGIQMEKKSEEENVEISDIQVEYQTNELQYEASMKLLDDETQTNQEQGWSIGIDGTLYNNQIILGQKNKIVTSEVITTESEADYQNQIIKIKYKKTITNEDGTSTESEVEISDSLASEKVKILPTI